MELMMISSHILKCYKIETFLQSPISKGNSTKKPIKFWYVGKKYLYNN